METVKMETVKMETMDDLAQYQQLLLYQHKPLNVRFRLEEKKTFGWLVVIENHLFLYKDGPGVQRTPGENTMNLNMQNIIMQAMRRDLIKQVQPWKEYIINGEDQESINSNLMAILAILFNDHKDFVDKLLFDRVSYNTFKYNGHYNENALCIDRDYAEQKLVKKHAGTLALVEADMKTVKEGSPTYELLKKFLDSIKQNYYEGDKKCHKGVLSHFNLSNVCTDKAKKDAIMNSEQICPQTGGRKRTCFLKSSNYCFQVWPFKKICTKKSRKSVQCTKQFTKRFKRMIAKSRSKKIKISKKQ